MDNLVNHGKPVQFPLFLPGTAVHHDNGGEQSVKDPILTRYKSTVAWLKDVASGIVSLPCAGSASGETADGVEINPGTRDW